MNRIKTKQGAASIYMVIVCALLFSVITSGFITLMVNEMSKSNENSLSQNAYESSLAGIEDAKKIIQKYYECGSSNEGGCKKISDNSQTILSDTAADDDCKNKLEAISDVLYNNKYVDNGVLIKETTMNGEDIAQAYTCIKIDLEPKDYLATLDQSVPQRLIPLNANIDNKEIKSVKISWYSTDNLGNSPTNFANINTGEMPIFGEADKNEGISNPPVLVAQFFQTREDFNFNEDLAGDYTNENSTLWLVPSSSGLPPGYTDNYMEEGGQTQYGVENNHLSETAFEKAAIHDDNGNNAEVFHNAFPVRCAENANDVAGEGTNYLCSVTIDIPSIKDKNHNANVERSNEYGAFLLSLSLPYQTPSTDIKVEMIKSGNNIAKFSQVQTVIDSTGRANDIYSRTESRIEFYDSSFPFPDYAMALNGDNGGTSLQKTFSVASEDGCWSYNGNNVNTCTTN